VRDHQSENGSTLTLSVMLTGGQINAAVQCSLSYTRKPAGTLLMLLVPLPLCCCWLQLGQ
jgi:hypothetical protein